MVGLEAEMRVLVIEKRHFLYDFVLFYSQTMDDLLILILICSHPLLHGFGGISSVAIGFDANAS